MLHFFQSEREVCIAGSQDALDMLDLLPPEHTEEGDVGHHTHPNPILSHKRDPTLLPTLKTLLEN